uniref:Olfactory receptor n=1 Tax=Podarcis muralis TaxID=64176 RepID=A0A670JF95_PODMU
MPYANSSAVREFYLVGFPTEPSTQLLLFFLVLTNYLITLSGNTVIICITLSDHRLQSPMYFFLRNFSFAEIWFTTVTVPKLLAGFLWGSHTISFVGCMTQCYFYFLLGATEFLLLGVMSFDRYQAVCNPLRYPALMTRNQACIQMLVGSWLGGFLSVLFPTILITRLSFCRSNVINHFFCDSGPLLELSCSDTSFIELMDFFLSAVVIICSLTVTLFSYMFIISAVMHISSTTGRAKAFNTCASHLTIISISCSISIFIYVTPSQKETLEVHKVPATIVCPFLNPFIFTLKNDTVKQALKDVLRQYKVLVTQKAWGSLQKKRPI